MAVLLLRARADQGGHKGPPLVCGGRPQGRHGSARGQDGQEHPHAAAPPRPDRRGVCASSTWPAAEMQQRVQAHARARSAAPGASWAQRSARAHVAGACVLAAMPGCCWCLLPCMRRRCGRLAAAVPSRPTCCSHRREAAGMAAWDGQSSATQRRRKLVGTGCCRKRGCSCPAACNAWPRPPGAVRMCPQCPQW